MLLLSISKSVYIFLHFYNGGEFANFIKNKKRIEEKHAARITEQLLKGLIELHKKKLVHRDLKPANILLHFEWMDPSKSISKSFYKTWDYNKQNWFTVIVADLGIGRECELEMTKGAGTPLYMAPEVNDKSEYNNKIDVYSLGIIVYEMLFGEPLFTSK